MATEVGIRVCAPVHDAILVEAPVEQIDAIVRQTQEIMAESSRIILDGFSLSTDAEIVRWPDRYMDEKRGRSMWDRVMNLAKTCGGERARLADQTCTSSTDHQRAARRPDPGSSLGNRLRIGLQPTRRFRREPFVEYQWRCDLAAQYVGGEFDIRRAGFAELAEGASDGYVEFAQRLFRYARGAGVATYRLQDFDVRDVLQRAHVGLRARGATADQEHRRARTGTGALRPFPGIADAAARSLEGVGLGGSSGTVAESRRPGLPIDRGRPGRDVPSHGRARSPGGRFGRI